MGLVGIGLAFLFFSPGTSMIGRETADETSGEPYKEIVNPSGFVNTPPITIGELVGKKVILVDFLTYSCINCQRTFPYLNAWYEAYRDQGLEIIGIHTPEFAFEKDIGNVQKAMRRYGIMHPIVLDNDYATWRAYGNRFWPRKYLIDIHGVIVYDHIGEGAYQETEMKIRELLEDRARVLGEASSQRDGSLVASRMPETPKAPASPEIYFGAHRNEYLGNGKSLSRGEQTFIAPKSIQLNTLYLAGLWAIHEEYAESKKESGIIFKYRAKDVYMVAGSDTPVDVEIFMDNNVKVKDITILEEGLYTVIEGLDSGEHVLELKIKSAGLRVFTFTFG